VFRQLGNKLVSKGRDAEKDEVVRWCRDDLRAQITHRFSVTLHKRIVSKLLRTLGLAWMQPRPNLQKKDVQAKMTYKSVSLWKFRGSRLGPKVCFPPRLCENAPGDFGKRIFFYR